MLLHKFALDVGRLEARLSGNSMKEELTFWLTVILLTLATIIIIGEMTGLVDGFIKSFE